MDILISGATGLVGRNAVMLANRHELNNVWTVSRSYGDSGKSGRGFRDMDLVTGNSFDLVIHAAAATPNNTISSEIKTMNRKIDGSLARLIENNTVRHVVYISSMSAYGRITTREVDEKTYSVDPTDYGLSKLLGEEMVKKACAITGTKLTILRSPGIVGKGMPAVFFYKCIELIEDEKCIRVPSIMAEFNNAIYVDDIYHTCINAYTSQREDDMIINLHSSDTVTLGEFVNMIASKTGKHATIEEDESMPASFTIANKTSGGLLITRTLEGIVDAYFRSVMVS